jgi:hypothetical protein
MEMNKKKKLKKKWKRGDAVSCPQAPVDNTNENVTLPTIVPLVVILIYDVYDK